MKLTKLQKEKKSFGIGILNRCLYGSCGFDVKTGVEFYGVYIRLRWIFPYSLYCILMGFLRSQPLPSCNNPCFDRLVPVTRS